MENIPEAENVHDAAAEAAIATDSFAGLTEDLALAQLEDRDLEPEAAERISQDATVMKSRKVRMALAGHPRTPRRVALRLIRELHTFELMLFTLLPSVAADLRQIADQALLTRLPAVTLGERISLARRGSGMVAGALLLEKDAKVWQAALENPRVNEAAVVKGVLGAVSPPYIEAVSRHPKWSLRADVRAALLRSAHLSLGKALEFAQRISPDQLRDILYNSKLPEKIKECVQESCASRQSSDGC
jgi:hypothetical protein